MESDDGQSYHTAISNIPQSDGPPEVEDVTSFGEVTASSFVGVSGPVVAYDANDTDGFRLRQDSSVSPALDGRFTGK